MIIPGFLVKRTEGSGGGSSYTPTHYVTTTGTASWANATSPSTPCSLSTAMSNASAGDIVQVGPGVYTGSNNNDRWQVSWQPANSGSSGNPIIFFAEYPAVHNTLNRSELRNGTTTMGSGCPTFGTSGEFASHDYIIWDGFYTTEANSATHSDTGPVVLHETTGSEIRRCLIEGVTATWSDNHNGIRFEHATSCKALDNKLTGFRCDTTNDWNEAAILLYASTDFTIAYNETTDNTTGMYLKGAAGIPTVYLRTPGSVHHNKIHNNDAGGMRIGGVNRNTGFVDIYQNLLYGHDDINDQDVSWQTWGDPAPLDVRFVNNTLASTGDANSYFKDDSPGATVYNGCVFQNNIVNDRLTGDEALSTQFDQFGTVDYNCYTNATMFNSDSFTSFQTEGLDTNGQQASPGFVGGGDYTLDTGSNCLNAGQDILDLLGGGTSASINQGCYILADQSDEIGPRTEPNYPEAA